MTDEKIIIGNINQAYSFVATCDPYKIRKAVLSIPECEDMKVWVIALRGTNGSWDKKLLYIQTTRALHRLCVLYTGEPSKYLK